MGNYYVIFAVPFRQLQRLFARSKISKVALATRVPTANVTSYFLTPVIFTRLGWEWYHKNAGDYRFATMQRKWGIIMSDFQFHFASSNVCLVAQKFPRLPQPPECQLPT